MKFLRRRFFTKKSSWIDRHFVLVLVVAALFAMAISMFIGLHQSVWFDEAYSITLAKEPIAELLRLTSIDTHPPLYYILLKAWAALFGWGEFALRSLSVLAFGGAVFIAGLLTRRLFNARVALLTLPFLVLAPFMLRYGFEIRMYALAALIGIAATYVLIRAQQSKGGRSQVLLYATYAALVAIGVYTLYYLALLWIAHVVWLVWVSLQDRTPLKKWYWALAYVGSVVLFSPWLSTFLSQINNGALSSVVRPLGLEQLLGIVSFNFLYLPAWQVGVIATATIAYVFGMIIYFAIRAFKKVSRQQKRYLVLLGLYTIVPIILLMLVSLRKPMYVERYMAHVIIGGLLFVGVTVALVLSNRASKRLWAAAGGLVAVMIAGTVHLAMIGNYNFQRSQAPAAKQIAAYVASTCDSEAAVVTEDPYYAIELSYYLPDCQIYFYSETAELSGGYAMLSNSPLRVSNPIDLIGASDRMYYVHGPESTAKPADRYQLISEQAFDGVRVDEFSAE